MKLHAIKTPLLAFRKENNNKNSYIGGKKILESLMNFINREKSMVCLNANKTFSPHKAVIACKLEAARHYYNEQLEDKSSYPAILLGNLMCLLDDNCSDFFPVLGDGQLQMRKAGPKAITQRVPAHADFKLYPNPATSHTSLAYQTNSSSKSFSLGIYNTQGQIVHRIALTKNRDEIVIATDQFVPGLYLVQLRDENGLIIGSGKLVKK